MMDAVGFDAKSVSSVENLQFIPVQLLKELELRSIPENEIFKTLTSSGTSGQRVSKIFLDKETSINQQKVLTKIVTSITGNSRMPMIIIDCPSVLKDRKKFSARGAGIVGFSIFGKNIIYALDDNMNLQVDKILSFLEENKDKQIFLFGFTFIIWQHFYKELLKINSKLNLENAILIHGGGWKKLIDSSVSSSKFRQALKETCGISKVFSYYGMVEQTGCIYIECAEGHLHASIFSDVIIRRGIDFSVCEVGESGIIQVLSMLPKSYPGHSLLTEDEGMILGIDDCPCGRKGKYFKVIGRLANAELRGCSDTYAAGF
jgi:phenylacetate-coenzyme A ligase PaaK-like adenylate-forming protein